MGSLASLFSGAKAGVGSAVRSKPALAGPLASMHQPVDPAVPLDQPTRAQREDDKLAVWNDMIRNAGLPVKEIYEPVMLDATFNALRHTPTTVVGGGWELLKAVGGAYMDAVKKNITPEQHYFKDLWKPIGMNLDWAVKAMNLGTGGYGDAIKQMYEENLDEDDKLKMGSLAVDIGADMVGWDMAKDLWSGRNPETGEMLTPEEWGMRGMGLALTVIPITRGAAKAVSMAGKGVKKHAQRTARTRLQMNQELDLLQDGMNQSDVNLRPEWFGNNPAVQELVAKFNAANPKDGASPIQMGRIMGEDGVVNIDPVLDVFSQGMTPPQTWTLTTAFMKTMGHKLDNNPAELQKMMVQAEVRRMMHSKKPTTTEHMASMIEQGIFNEETIRDLMITELKGGMTPDQLNLYNTQLANTLRLTERRGGQTLNVMSKALSESVDNVFPENPELAGAIKETWSQMAEPGGVYNDTYGKFSANFNALLRLKRAALTSGPVTFTRNFVMGGANFGLSFAFESVMNDVVHATTSLWGKHVSKALPTQGQYGGAMHNTLFSINTLMAGINAGVLRGSRGLNKRFAGWAEKNGTVGNLYAGAQLASKTVYDKLDGVSYIPTKWWKEKSKVLESHWGLYDRIMEAMDPIVSKEIDQNMGDIQTRAVFNYAGELKGPFHDSIRALSKAPEGAGTLRQIWGLPWKQKAAVTADFLSILNRGQEMWWRKIFYIQEMDRHAIARGYKGAQDFVHQAETNPQGLKNSFVGPKLDADDVTKKLLHIQDNLAKFTKDALDADPTGTTAVVGSIQNMMRSIERKRKADNKQRIKESKPPKPEEPLEKTQRMMESELAKQFNIAIDGALMNIKNGQVVTGQRLNDATGHMQYFKEIVSNQNVDEMKTKLRKLGYDEASIDNVPVNLEQLVGNMPEQFHAALGGVFENDSTIVTHSTDAALSNTFAAHPKGGFAKTILGFYQKMPFLAEMGIMFPRFLVNQWMWLWERNPTQLLHAFGSDEFRGITSGHRINPVFAKKMALGMEGLLLNQTAWLLRNSKMAGPKYYQIDTGAEDEEGNRMYIDARPFNPLASYLFFQQAARQSFSDHELPNKMTASEWTDGFVGVRRLQDAPLFSIPYVAQAFERGNAADVSEMFARMAGDAVRGFLVPFKTANEIMGGVGELVHEWEGDDSKIGNIGLKVSKEALEMKTAMEDEFFGNIVADVPFARSVVPTRIDPYTGEYSRSTAPLKRQLLGITTRTQTEWENIMGEVNLKSFDMIGKWRSRSAIQSMSTEIGMILQSRQKNGRTLGENLANMIRERSQGLPIEEKRKMVQDVNKDVREAATAQAARKYPKLFEKEIALKEAGSLKRNVELLLK